MTVARKNQGNTVKINGVTLTRKIVHEIGKFAVLWNVFENNICENHCNNDKLREIAPTITGINTETLEVLANALQGRIDLRANGVDEYVKYILVPENARKMNPCHAAEVTRFINSKGKESLAGGLIAIFRIRNNMFHGLKELTSLDGQIELFKAINIVLAEIVKRGN